MEAFIQKQDLKILVEMGRALWMDPRESQHATIETLSAVTLLDLTPDRALEKAAAALLERVKKRGGAANFRSNLEAGLGIGQSFYRLLPEERFLLVALHMGRWSYARLSRVFGEPAEQIEAQAWSARLRLASNEQGVPYPAGAPVRGPHCPEYDPKRPWTQRFLDEEIVSGRERMFFQNHLMACSSCREALGRCRETYYAIEQRLPRRSSEENPEQKDDAQMLRSLETIARRGMVLRMPADRTLGESLAVFVRRRDVQFVLIAFGAIVAWKILRS